MARESITAGDTAGGTRRAATHYGRRTEEGPYSAQFNVTANEWKHTTTFTYDALPTATLDELHQRIPQHARVTKVELHVTKAFVSTSGTTTLDVGLQQPGGTEIDNDGLIAAAAADGLVISSFLDGGAALVGAATGIAEAGLVVVTPSVDDLEAGEATITVTYERLDARLQTMNG